MLGAVSTPNAPQTPAPLGSASFSVDIKPDITELDASVASQVALQTKLNRRLGPEYVSQRPAPGGGPKLTYVEGWKIIGLANEVFGFNGWSSSIVSVTTDFIDCDPETRRHCVGVTAVIKITLKDGTFHEDVGYGTADNVKSKGAALDKAKKEAVTDGVKRALRNFGNLLGLCLYEKAYAQEIAKIKVPPVRFDKSDLHHGPDRSTPAPADAASTPAAGSSAAYATNTNRTPISLQQDVKPLTSIPPHMRVGGSAGGLKGKAPQTPATNSYSLATGNAAMTSSGASSATGLTTPIRTPVPRTNAGATSFRPPAPRPAQNQPALNQNATSAPAPAAPAPRNASSSERKVAFAPDVHNERQQPVQAPGSRQPLAAMKSEPDLDRFFTASDDDAMMALDLEGLEDFDAELSPTVETKNGNANGTGAGNTGLGKENAETKSSAPASRSAGQVAAPRTSPGGFHFTHAAGNRPAASVHGQTRQPQQQTSASASSSIGSKRPAEAMQQGGNNARRPIPQGVGSGQPQHIASNRPPLANLDIASGGDVKRFKR